MQVDMKDLALEILRIERAGGTEEEKMARLRELLRRGEKWRDWLPAAWILEAGELLSWEENLLALAERVLGLPQKPWGPESPALAAWGREVDELLGRAGRAEA
jgi:hypothetical protein